MVLLRMEAGKEKVSPGGIVLTATQVSTESSGYGVVVNFGELAFKIHKDLNINTPARVGDCVRVPQYCGYEFIEIEDTSHDEVVVYRLVKDSDILGVVEKEV